jgi:endonuclease/exonuclease/phosphatase (EEP) superfamily protein YafD
MVQTAPPGPGHAPGRPLAKRVIAAVIVLVVVSITALVLLPDELGLDRWLPFTALVAFRWQLTAAAALVAVAMTAWRPLRVAGIAALLICAVAGALVVPRAVASAVPAPGGRELTMLSFNVDRGRADVPALAAAIRRERPDVVVLPESADRFRGLVGRSIPDLGYRFSVAVPPGADDVDGITVLTGPGLGAVGSRVISEGPSDPWLELTGGGLGSVRLVAVHISAPWPGKIQSWPGELAQLRTWCGAGSGPAVVVGDFNATLDHRELREGTQGCRDAGDLTGQGLTPTWDTEWPAWFGAQIDHVLAGGGPQPTGLRILDLPGSDHRALLARVRMTA